jgi:cytoskeleton protein RodZ
MMFSVGQRLRQARLDQGLDLDTLAARTKISEKFLKAIEADDRTAFPGGFFYKSFVDQYAHALSLDTREIDDEINQLLSAEAPLPLPGQGETPAKKVSPLILTPQSARRRVYASVATFILVLVGCSGLFAWWHNLSTQVAAPVAVKTEIAPKGAPVVETPIPAPLPPANPQRPPQPAAVPVSLAASPRADASPPDISQAEPRLLLELMARQETWLAISSDGLMVFKGTLGANESKTIEGKEFAKLRVNNPAALDVRLNGKSLGPLGPPGQFLVVVFTRDKFHVLDSAKESD